MKTASLVVFSVIHARVHVHVHVQRAFKHLQTFLKEKEIDLDGLVLSQDLVLEVVDLLHQCFPVGREEEVVVREVREVSNTHELQNIWQKGNLLEGSCQRKQYDEDRQAADADGNGGGLVLSLVPFVLVDEMSRA